MKSNYYFDTWYIGIACIAEPKESTFYVERRVDNSIKVRYYGGEKVESGFAYKFQNLYGIERPYGNYMKKRFI